MAAENAILNATEALRPLRNEVGNFFLFEDEVKTALTSMFEKHCVGQSSFLFSKMLHRLLCPRMKARSAWIVEFKRAMSSEIFSLIFQCKKGPFHLWCFVQRRKTHRCNLLSPREQTYSRFCQVIRAKQRLSPRIPNEEE